MIKAKTGHLLFVDGLRGISILAVLLGHFFPAIVKSGYLGVDIFFVISGFVITKYLSENRFSSPGELFSTFYARRLRRLMPALLVCILLTALLSTVFLPNAKKMIYVTGGLSALGASNIHLFLKAREYFAVNNQLNPFTHTWSLGVEEQFYLIYPAIFSIFVFTAVRSRTQSFKFYTLLALSILSILGWLYANSTAPLAAFYLMPFRLWELGLGCLCFNAVPIKSLGFLRRFNLVAIFMLVGICVQDEIATPFGNIAACVLTACLLHTISNFPSQNCHPILENPMLEKLGKLSYSLYLWHWPVMVFAYHIGGTFVVTKVVAIAFCLLLATASLRCLELPIRRNVFIWSNEKSLGLFAGAGFLTALAIAFVIPNLNSYDFTIYRYFGIATVRTWHPQCHGLGSVPAGTNIYDFCLAPKRSVKKPHVVFLIGDSHAAQFGTMVANAIETTQYQYRFLNAEQDDDFPLVMFESTKQSPYATTDYILKHGSPGDIILVAIHRGHFNALRDNHIQLSDNVEVNLRETRFVENMDVLAKAFAKAGVKVVFVRDTPLLESVLPMESCKLQTTLWGSNTCNVSLKQDLQTRKRYDRSVDTLRQHNKNVFAWDPLPIIYHGAERFDVTDGMGNYLMYDWNHISEYQSVKLAPAFSTFFDSLVLKSD